MDHANISSEIEGLLRKWENKHKVNIIYSEFKAYNRSSVWVVTHQTDERVVLKSWARCRCDHARPEKDALLLQKLLDAAHMGVKSVQIPQLTVFLLGAADEQQQLSDLPPDKRGLLNHQVLAEKEEKKWMDCIYVFCNDRGWKGKK